MPVTYEFYSIAIADIIIPEDRQRRALKNVDNLAASIARNGLLHPIIITRDLRLIAGERRLEAMKTLGATHIHVHYLDELDEFESVAIELEENIKRKDLHWKEYAHAVKRYHATRLDQDVEWTQARTGEALGIAGQWVSITVQVATELETAPEDSLIYNATGLEMAYRHIRRKHKRAVDTELAQIDLSSIGVTPIGETTTEKEHSALAMEQVVEEEEKEPSSVYSVGTANFLDWAATYSGRKFNFLHCDFPFGIGYDKTKYFGSAAFSRYADTPDLYFALLDCLIENKDRLLSSSAHIMFWFSMTHYHETLQRLTGAGFAMNPFPLVWMKDRGIVPDGQRGPKRIYETAFFGSLGDRRVVRSPPNAFRWKVEKSGHISTKPGAVCGHFLKMFVDDNTEMLDPTCGSGQALAAAISLGATRVHGLDIEAEYVETTILACKLATTGTRDEQDAKDQTEEG